jgi:exodeoxyribonuclease-1
LPVPRAGGTDGLATGVSFIIYDLETTGLNARYDQIVQFGAIRFDARLNIIDRFHIRSRLQPHIVPSPGALVVTGTPIAQLLSTEHPSHFEMMREVNRVMRSWGPSVYLGYNSMRFDEEFLRHALYQSLLDPYLTNKEKNTRGDVLRLIRAAVHFRPDLVSTPMVSDGVPSTRLLDVAAALGFVVQRGHEAIADVEMTAFVCQQIARRAPEVWSRFLQFTTKAAAVEFMQTENAFVLFHPTGNGRGCYVVSFFGRHPSIANFHYCLDLSTDLESLRPLSLPELTLALAGTKIVRRVKANAGPVLFPVYEGLEKAFSPLTEDEVGRKAASLRADSEFVERLTAAAIANERVFPPSENVEDQLYEQGRGFFDDSDSYLMGEFHKASWSERPGYLEQMRDSRLKRLGQRAIYFERPDLLVSSTRKALDRAIQERLIARDEKPWRTIAKARKESAEVVDREVAGLEGFETYLNALESPAD